MDKSNTLLTNTCSEVTIIISITYGSIYKVFNCMKGESLQMHVDMTESNHLVPKLNVSYICFRLVSHHWQGVDGFYKTRTVVVSELMRFIHCMYIHVALCMAIMPDHPRQSHISVLFVLCDTHRCIYLRCISTESQLVAHKILVLDRDVNTREVADVYVYMHIHVHICT